jgi:hypothetical protein
MKSKKNRGDAGIDAITAPRKGALRRMAKAPKTLEGGTRSIRKVDEPDAARPMPLNFKVPADFRREFKTYAAQQNKKLNQLLYEAFAALKAKNAE